MADSVTINGGKSASEVAYTLLLGVASREGKHTGYNFIDCDRAYILDTYAECMRAAQGRRATKPFADSD